MSEKLENEIIEYIESHFHIRSDETLEVGNAPLTTYDFEEIAKHFYLKGYEQAKQKSIEWLKSKGGFTIGFDGASIKDFEEGIKD